MASPAQTEHPHSSGPSVATASAIAEEKEDDSSRPLDATADAEGQQKGDKFFALGVRALHDDLTESDDKH